MGGRGGSISIRVEQEVHRRGGCFKFVYAMVRARESVIGDLSLFISMHGGNNSNNNSTTHEGRIHSHTHTFILGDSTRTSLSLSSHREREI